jgi:hypothetical protein
LNLDSPDETAPAIYRVIVNSSSFSAEEIRAAAHTHRELGPEYEGAVIESFLEKVGREIDARVDDRLGHMGRRGRGKSEVASARHQHGAGLALPVISMVLGIPLTAIAVSGRPAMEALMGLVIVWAAIVAINVAYSVGARRRER